METTLTGRSFTSKAVLACILGALIIYFFSTSIASSRLSEYEQVTRVAVADQQTMLVAIAEATGRNGADVTTESVIKDCTLTEREEFDVLLGRLNAGLSQAELSTLERLFGRCGSFYAERKSVMVSRLTREIEIFKTYVAQLSAIEGSDLAEAFAVADWEALAVAEQKQSELFTKLVAVQDTIITTLLSGKSANSDEIQEILQNAEEIQQTLFVTNKIASDLRKELVPL